MDGLPSLAADLRKAGTQAAPKAREAVRKTAYDIARDAQAAVPVDTGATKASIGVDFGGSSGSLASATIGPTTSYAPYLEYGTRRMPARPFMGPAADRHIPALAQALEQIGGELLDG